MTQTHQDPELRTRMLSEAIADALDATGVTVAAATIPRLLGTTEQTGFTYTTIAGTKYLASYVEAGQRVTIARDTDGSVLSVTKGPGS
jgi:hypothetical protein